MSPLAHLLHRGEGLHNALVHRRSHQELMDEHTKHKHDRHLPPRNVGGASLLECWSSHLNSHGTKYCNECAIVQPVR